MSYNNNNEQSCSPCGVVVGCYEDMKEWSTLGSEINSKTNDALINAFRLSDNKGKSGDSLLVYNVTPEFPRVAIVGLGKFGNTCSIYEQGENIRRAVGKGVKSLKAAGATKIAVDTSIGELRACSEGAHLSVFKYEIKSTSKNITYDIQPYQPEKLASLQAWEDGKVLADAQNFARRLADTPANLMTPTIFVQQVKEKFQALESSGKVEIIAHDRKWAEEKKMGMFLGVAVGSDEPPIFLEINYRAAQDKTAPPVVYVGKGVTFDTGGISLKPPAAMGLMRGDMQGAAVTVSSIYAAATLGLNVNLTVLTPLTENMPSGKATKPGDVLIAANGMTIEVDNTDAEGRLILGDALHYAHTFNPVTIVDVATLTGAMDIALGAHLYGCFAGSDELWQEIDSCGQYTGERPWRMPLLKEYRKQLDSKYADMVNSAGRSGGACAAAMFLKEFVQIDRWAHLDIAGVSYTTEDGPYIVKGMTGKPVRTLVELARRHFNK
ncbi:hypothetical protein SAMD00019534_114050, partial [Acytostelium subglobosum LB1]|uniref:hypothetical protein n=1 Tax=Acytostelium subglobosum LB1 TaxID=1410327 RepID=UPI00064512FF